MITSILAAAISAGLHAAPPPAPVELAAACYFSREEFKGSVKVCYYNCGGATFSMVVRLTESCPFQVDPG